MSQFTILSEAGKEKKCLRMIYQMSNSFLAKGLALILTAGFLSPFAGPASQAYGASDEEVVTAVGNSYDKDVLNEQVERDYVKRTEPVQEETASPPPVQSVRKPVQEEKPEPAQTEKSPSAVEEAIQLASKDTTAPGNVSLDFKDADILNVLRVLSLKSGTNIVAGPEVQGTVTIRLQDVPWEKAMDVVLRTYGYVYERDGNIIRVTTKENLATEELVTETFVLNYTTAADVEEAIKDILTERGRVKSVPKANTIIVSDAPTNMYKIGQVIQSLDKVTPQVYIDAKVIKTQLDEGEDLGIKWNLSSANTMLTGASRPTTFPFSAAGTQVGYNPLTNRYTKWLYPSQQPAANQVEDRLSYPNPTSAAAPTGNTYAYGTLDFSKFTMAMGLLRQKNSTKIVSNPRIVVLNNQTAKVQVGSQVPIPTFERNETTGSFVISGFEYRDVGVVLNVTPHINQSREILVDVKPEVSSRSGSESFGSGSISAPIFNTTTAQTQLLIRDGETIAIGGLMRDSEAIETTAVPGISKIPIFGRLFKNSSRSTTGDANQQQETLFFVTIQIVDTEGQPTLVQPTKGAGKPIAMPAASTVVTPSI